MTDYRYINGVGRLVTDRYDSEKHFDGYSLRHKATQINMDPTIVPAKTDVQSMLQYVYDNLTPAVSDATTTVKGILKLAGDIGGTATSVSVDKIKGKAISVLAPTLNQVLQWDGSAWTPSTLSSFSAGNDLSGSISSQNVLSATGLTNTFSIKCNNITFTDTVTPLISQTNTTSLTANPMTISAQNSDTEFSTGGGLFLKSGYGILSSSYYGYLSADLRLYLGGGHSLVQLTEPSTEGIVLALACENPITTTEMPAGTGSHVIYIHDAVADPTIPPVSGSILYSSGGKLHVAQSAPDSLNFTIQPSPIIAMGYKVNNNLVHTTSSDSYVTTGSNPNEMIATISGSFLNGDIIRASYGGKFTLSNVPSFSGTPKATAMLRLSIKIDGGSLILIPGSENYIEYDNFSDGYPDYHEYVAMKGVYVLSAPANNISVYTEYKVYVNTAYTIATYALHEDSAAINGHSLFVEAFRNS